MSKYWYRGLPAKGARISSRDVGKMRYWIAGQVDGWAPAGAAMLAGTGVLGLAGISFGGAGGRKETGAGNLGFQGVSFNGGGNVVHVKGSGTLALSGISISASGFNVGQPGGLRQFWTC
jgi:hypothetical protein